MKTQIGLSLVLFVASSTKIMAEEPSEETKKISVVDFNKDGFLSDNEVRWGVLNHVLGGAVRFDVPINTVASEDDMILGLANDRDKQTIFKSDLKTVRDLLATNGRQKPYKIDTLDDLKLGTYFQLTAPKAEVVKPNPGLQNGKEDAVANADDKKGRFYLRRSIDKVPTPGDDDGLGKSGKGIATYVPDAALFSYGSANGKGHEVAATGVFAYASPVNIQGTDGSNILGTFEFTRVNFSGGDKPTNASPRFQDESSVANAGISLDTFLPGFPAVETNLRTGVFLDSDWNFKSKLIKASLDLTFYRKKYGLGAITNAGGLFYQIDLSAHADYGYVAQGGPWLKVGKYGDRPGHAGPNVGLTIYPFHETDWWQATPVSLTFTYLKYFKFNHDAANVHRTSVQLNWYFKKPGTKLSDAGLALTVLYQDQKNVENSKDDDSVLAGFAVAY